MSIAIGAPVSTIEGIGPAIADALAGIGVWTVLDLLRVPARRIHDAVRSMASDQQVRGWKRMAMLLQVHDVSAQWAEALVKHGVETIDELQRKQLDDITAVMRAAKKEGVIAEAPTANQVANMLRDAAVILRTGAFSGRVIDAEGKPVAGAVVGVGYIRGESDDRGRFRVLRIPLGRDVTVRVTHPDHAPLVLEYPSISSDAGTAGSSVLRLQPGSTSNAEPVTLSELDGDLLPLSYHVARQVLLAPDALRDGDILVVREVTAGGEVQLVSKLKSWRDGELLVTTVRVPASRVPAGVQPKQQFRVVGDQLVPNDMSAGRLHREKIRLRLRRILRERGRPTTPEEVSAFMGDVRAVLAGLKLSRRTR